MQEIKNNPQVYTTQEGMQEIKNNPQVYTTQEGIEEIKSNPQVYTTHEGIEEIKSNPQIYNIGFFALSFMRDSWLNFALKIQLEPVFQLLVS